MAYTTNQLIAGAYYAAGVVSREFETISGSQLTDGLQWVNDIIGDKDVDQGMVPYEDKLSFNAVTGQEVYFLPNVTQIDTLVFYLDSVRYAMNYSKRNQYFGSSRVENITSLPFEWYFERKSGGGNLYIYFKPDRNYPIEIHGIFRVPNVSLGQDLTSNTTLLDLGIPTFYGDGSLSVGQLLINTIDLNGEYPNIGAFINYINSGVITGVTARIDVNNVILTSETVPPTNIFIQTAGYSPSGTSFISNVAAATAAALPGCVYSNGTDGIGATLESILNGALTVDGHAVSLNERIIVKDQTNEIQNGLYTVTQVGSGGSPWILTRSANYNKSYQIGVGTIFTATNGTVNDGLSFVETAEVSVIGTDDIIFEEFNSLTFSNFSTIEEANYNIVTGRGFDQFYISYLRYALADRICTEYNYDTPMNVAKQLATYEAWIKKKSRLLDLRMEKVSTLQRRGSFNWAFVNLGKGWSPS